MRPSLSILSIISLAFWLAASSSTVFATERVDALIEQARQEQWSADHLFEYLRLDEGSDECRIFADSVALQERHARWREAVFLLAAIDADALDDWFVGRSTPPRAVQREVSMQLHCMITALVDAAIDTPYKIRIFRDMPNRFQGRFRDAPALAQAARQNPRWYELTANAVTRSVERNIHSQAHIWHRKFVFSGRNFNRITDEAALDCGFPAGSTWRPQNHAHRRCWEQTLSAQEREREILSASAAPGLSRHHWGTDVDILGLNPVHFREGGAHHGDWQWLDDQALDFGFFQPYQGQPPERRAHMEERWHWSYFPIAQALWDFAAHQQDHIEEVLNESWDHFERRWGALRGPYFDHMRQYWRDYLFNIYVPPVPPS